MFEIERTGHVTQPRAKALTSWIGFGLAVRVSRAYRKPCSTSLVQLIRCRAWSGLTAVLSDFHNQIMRFNMDT